jgi:hypothetical protein
MADASVQLNIVQLLPKHVLICYDLFLDKSDERIRSEIAVSFERPIHKVFKIGNVYHIQRDGGLDGMVAAEYKRMESVDKGPRPFFADVMNPPVYDQGERIEARDWQKEEDKSEEDRSEENRSESEGRDPPEEAAEDARTLYPICPNV